MGCNAWNHPPDCNCGWGGDTGGGGYRVSSSGIQLADGRLWNRSVRPKIESYVNPNALCPVCGAKVFFYQSEIGGRVFFDKLGPPWPKHPCTDNSYHKAPASHKEILVAASDSRASGVRPKQTGQSPTSGTSAVPTKWRPLFPLVRPEEETDCVIVTFLSGPTPTPTTLAIPKGFWSGAPIYWRWSRSNLGFIELSTLDSRDILDIQIIETSVPGWEAEDSNLPWKDRGPATSDWWNKLGWHLSFQHAKFDTKSRKYSPTVFGGMIDWALATSCFEKAAAAGNRAAQNNLGVISRDGLGVQVDHMLAFQWFYQAAESGENRALENLERCYRNGLGCKPNQAMANFLEALRNLDQDQEVEPSTLA